WYAGGLAVGLGGLCLLRPIAWLKIPSRRRALLVGVTGIGVAIGTLFVGTSLKRIPAPASLIDQVLPEFQFSETHQVEIAAAPPDVYRAVRGVTADEIALYRTLTWIRCLGRCPGDNILNPPTGTPILETAMRSGFRLIAETPDVELVLVTFVAAPSGTSSREWTRDAFVSLRTPGYAKAAMNFRLEPRGTGRTVLHTDTRVLATDSRTCRAFAAYWRTIVPGSDLIRRAWLRAIKRRAER
ncbi:MAG TPA: hypothetical protein VMS54_11560, partial [Vicinamibacterales bacterium]|nr:hypothetical protein [Vicinamibacterales bacterium]